MLEFEGLRLIFMHRWYILFIILLPFLAMVVWQRLPTTDHSKFSFASPIEDRAICEPIDEPIRPIPQQIALPEQKVELGEKLFHDPQLSHNNTISCASCHNLNTGGADRRTRSVGINGAEGVINTPTVFNSGFNFKQFWDGRAETLEDQIDGPIQSPHEMGSHWAEIIDKLSQSPYYVSTFQALYPEGIQIYTIKDAIATFERSLYTPNARFDQFLCGDNNALTPEEKAGYSLFKTYGCISCHQGINIGGNMFQKFGIMGDYFAERRTLTQADLGRFNVTQEKRDRHVFKVPSLRNIALTPPYFHDGSAERLEDAVIAMAKYQLGRQLSTKEVDLIVKFLQTLTGEYKRK